MPRMRYGCYALAWALLGMAITASGQAPLGHGPHSLIPEHPQADGGTLYPTTHSTSHSTLEEWMRNYERRLAALEQDGKKQPKKEAAKKPETKEEENPWKEVSSQGWSHSVGGRALTEYVMWPDGGGIPGTQNYAEIRQVRLEIAGAGYGVFDYRVQMDFEPEGRDTDDGGTIATLAGNGMKDVYVGMHEIPYLGYVRVGHFKVSFSHDQMLSRRDMTFMERFPMADPNGFTPGREVGIQAYNYSDDENFSWQYGAYFDSISESSKQRLDDNQGLTLNARGTWTPIYDEPSDGRYIVHLGLGAIYTDTQDGSGRFSQRPEIHEGPVLIDTGAIAASNYAVLGSEFLAQWGNVYVFNELMWANVNAVGGNIDLYSGYVEAGWRLTGEHRSYNRREGFFGDMTPHEGFWIVPGCHGMGAWEIAARWSFVDFTNAPNNSTYDSLGLALNWYWTPRLRAQLNYIMPYTSGAPLGNTESSILGMRLAAYF